MAVILNGKSALIVGGDITAGGFITGVKVGVAANLSASASTTIITAGTYYPIEGTFNNTPSELFSGTTVNEKDAIKYDGNLTQYFEVDWYALLKGNSNGITATIAIKKNGTVLTAQAMGIFMKTADEDFAVSGTSVFELTQNDTVQLVVTADGDGDVITFDNFLTTIHEFFD